MKCPCQGCDERKVGCHSDCPKEPSYDDWKQWVDGRATINRVVEQDNRDYLQSLVRATKVKRRKR